MAIDCGNIQAIQCSQQNVLLYIIMCDVYTIEPEERSVGETALMCKFDFSLHVGPYILYVYLLFFFCCYNVINLHCKVALDGVVSFIHGEHHSAIRKSEYIFVYLQKEYN